MFEDGSILTYYVCFSWSENNLVKLSKVFDF